MGKNIVVIPAFNEEATIGEVVRCAKKYCGVLVVDDCSTDRTAAIAEENGALVLRNKKNLGYDASISIGVSNAARTADVMILMDADGQHDARDIPRFLELIGREKADVVVGVRPYAARLAEKLFGKFAKWKIDVSDPLCGFKAFKTNLFHKLGYKSSVGTIGTNFLFQAKKQGFVIKEVSITLRPRNDAPRFGQGSALRAELKIMRALIVVLAKHLFD